jgi:asparagine synthase (glutamine-hydrolysing)
MCGLFISNSKEINISSEPLIEKGLGFRGPDGSSGLIFQNGWVSYHARLSIVDLSPGTNQPVLNKDLSQLVFNGEILNYKELGIKYFNKEYISDTYLLNDLIINDYLDLNELDGFFAFVFIDSNGDIKYACRDKFGVKPLFYYKNNKTIAFSSEPSVLKNLFSAKINKLALEEYRVFRAPIFSGSFFEGINQIEPGTCYKKGKYFCVEEELFSNDYNFNNLEMLNLSIKKGVSTRCIADAPIGLLLSKGIDSNLIRYSGNFNKLYTVGFDGDHDIEYLKKSNIPNLKVLRVNKDEFRIAFNHLLNLRQEPLSVPNEVLLYLVACEAKKDGVKVLLSGEGADEFFGGYDRIFKWASKSDEFVLDIFLDLYTYQSIEKGSQLYQSIKSIFSDCIISNPFEMVRWFFIRYHMPILFRRLDFALMAAGVEGREPIANYHVFKMCKEILAKDLMSNNLGKKPLRDILSRHMGKKFSFEEKIGFPVDLTKIFDNPNNKTSYELWFNKNLEVLS